MKYPDLIENAQFIRCSEEDDPTHKLAGRMPYFKEIIIEEPKYDHDYALQHYYGYKKRFIDVLENSDGELIGEVDYENERKIWGKQFAIHHDCYGEYYRLVHEYPNIPENREILDSDGQLDIYRPSNFPPQPHTIVKEPKGAYVSHFTCSLICAGIFLGAVKGIFSSM